MTSGCSSNRAAGPLSLRRPRRPLLDACGHCPTRLGSNLREGPQRGPEQRGTPQRRCRRDPMVAKIIDRVAVARSIHVGVARSPGCGLRVDVRSVGRRRILVGARPDEAVAARPDGALGRGVVAGSQPDELRHGAAQSRACTWGHAVPRAMRQPPPGSERPAARRGPRGAARVTRPRQCGDARPCRAPHRRSADRRRARRR